MLILSLPLTVLSVAMLPLFVWLTQRWARRDVRSPSTTQKSMADLTTITEETLSVSGILLSKAFGRQGYEIERFRKENERLTGLQIRQTMIGRSFFAIVNIFFSITPALVYLVGRLGARRRRRGSIIRRHDRGVHHAAGPAVLPDRIRCCR